MSHALPPPEDERFLKQVALFVFLAGITCGLFIGWAFWCAP